MKNIFIIRYIWLWSNPEGKYFYPAFLEQDLGTIHSKPFGFPFSLSMEGQRFVLHWNIRVRLMDPRCLSVAKLSRLEASQSFMWTFYADLVKLVPFFPLHFWHQKMDCFCSWNLRGQAEVGCTEESYNHVKICSVLTYLFVPFLLYSLFLFL